MSESRTSLLGCQFTGHLVGAEYSQLLSRSDVGVDLVVVVVWRLGTCIAGCVGSSAGWAWDHGGSSFARSGTGRVDDFTHGRRRDSHPVESAIDLAVVGARGGSLRHFVMLRG